MKLKTGVILFLFSATICFALDANDFNGLIGYTIIDETQVPGEFDGADYDKIIQFSNGMVFKFKEYNYSYAYSPDVVIFAKNITIKSYSTTFYKLLIDDEMYDAVRIK